MGRCTVGRSNVKPLWTECGKWVMVRYPFTILNDYFPKKSESLSSVLIWTATEGHHTKTVSFLLDTDNHTKIELATWNFEMPAVPL